MFTFFCCKLFCTWCKNQGSAWWLIFILSPFDSIASCSFWQSKISSPEKQRCIFWQACNWIPVWQPVWARWSEWSTHTLWQLSRGFEPRRLFRSFRKGHLLVISCILNLSTERGASVWFTLRDTIYAHCRPVWIKSSKNPVFSNLTLAWWLGSALLHNNHLELCHSRSSPKAWFYQKSLHVTGETLVWHFKRAATLTTRFENTDKITESMSMSESMWVTIVAETTIAFHLFSLCEHTKLSEIHKALVRVMQIQLDTD